jgi:RNA polymerase sigma-70 factor (ECF subfamily)
VDSGRERKGNPVEPRGSGRLATTSWSVVLAAGDRGSVNSREALSTLCQAYWYPLYAFARRNGMNAESAQDSAQGFFSHLLEKGSLRHAQPEKGRFRSFLLAAFKNFVADQRAYERRKKRGGDATKLPIDFDTAEGRYRKEPSVKETPERIYERRWAMALLDRAVEQLREDHVSTGREEVFDKLKVYLIGEKGSVPYRVSARELRISEISVKVAVHRLRRRFRAKLLDEISQTLQSEDDLNAEVRHLMAALEN